MARRRMIDPNFWSSEDVSQLNFFERLLLIGLFSNADDYGKGRAKPELLRSIIFPYDDISVDQISKALNNISKFVSIHFYEVKNSSYYIFPNWSKWQRVDKPQPSLIPDPTDFSKNDYQPKADKNDSKNDYKNNSGNDSRLIERKRKKIKIKEVKVSEDLPVLKNYSADEILIRSYGRNPTIPEREFLELLIERYGEEKTLKIMKEAKLRNFHNFRKLEESLDAEGNIKPKEENRNNGNGIYSKYITKNKLKAISESIANDPDLVR